MSYAGAYYQKQKWAQNQAACKQWAIRIGLVLLVCGALGFMYMNAPKWGRRVTSNKPMYSSGLVPGQSADSQGRKTLRSHATGKYRDDISDDYQAYGAEEDDYYGPRGGRGGAEDGEGPVDEEEEEEEQPVRRRKGGKKGSKATKGGSKKRSGRSSRGEDATDDEPAPKPKKAVKKKPVAPGLPVWGSTSVKTEGGGGADATAEEPAPKPSASPTPAATPSPSPIPPALDPSTLKSRLIRPPRDASLVPEQRPLDDGGAERDVTSHKYEELNIHSMNPPRPFNEMTSDPLELAELNSRLVIGVGMGVHSGNTDVHGKGLVSLPVFNTLLPTFMGVAQPTYIYRFYFAFDHNDPIYESSDWRGKIEREFYRMIAEEDAKRWHPEGYKAGETIDGSAIIATIHFVHCDYAAKPAWAHSDAIVAAYKEGADFAFRSNDDTAFPTAKDWADRMIADLRGRTHPLLGVTGPGCDEGANWILTHDFTHKTHVVIFGYHYPRSLPDWSSDDWITIVYRQYNPSLMSRREDAKVQHRLHGTRYNPQDRGTRLAALNSELENGANLIDAYTKQRYNVVIPHERQNIQCC